MPEIIVYTKDFCPYCHAAKELLRSKGAAFTEIDIEKAGGRTTVPQIFIAGKHVGGCDDIHALDEAGKLDPLLAA